MLGRDTSLGKSGGGPPQSKTLRAHASHRLSRQRLGLRQPSGALVRARQRAPVSHDAPCLLWKCSRLLQRKGFFNGPQIPKTEISTTDFTDDLPAGTPSPGGRDQSDRTSAPWPRTRSRPRPGGGEIAEHRLGSPARRSQPDDCVGSLTNPAPKLREQPDGGLLEKLVFGIGVSHC
jgi:hypothetical protein